MLQDDPSPNQYQVPPPTGYSVPGYNANQGNYSYYGSSPLPLGQAIRQLPNQYIKVLTRPSSFTFAAEMGKANWNIIWVQLIGYTVIFSVLLYLLQLFVSRTPITNTSNEAATKIVNASLMFIRILPFIFVIIFPVALFIGEGITYLLAKAFGGRGNFLRQVYTYLLIVVPVGIISFPLTFIPVLGTLVGYGSYIYSIVLQIFSLMAVHRLRGEKATAIVLIPIVVFYILFTILAIVTIWDFRTFLEG